MPHLGVMQHLLQTCLGGFLVTVDDSEEDQWLFDTFAVGNDTTRHLWIGLSDHQNEEDFRWHDGTLLLTEIGGGTTR